MSEQIGLWRATYTPGRWAVLAGPTSLVVLGPEPARDSSTLNSLWEVVVHADSLDHLVQELAQHNVARMPDFAAFFWHDGQMHSLVRGSLQVCDLKSGAVIASGEGVQTWTESGLGDVRKVRVVMEQDADFESELLLPLVLGAVAASSIELNADEAARISTPQKLGPVSGAAGPTEKDAPLAQNDSETDLQSPEDRVQDLFGPASWAESRERGNDDGGLLGVGGYGAAAGHGDAAAADGLAVPFDGPSFAASAPPPPPPRPVVPPPPNLFGHPQGLAPYGAGHGPGGYGGQPGIGPGQHQPPGQGGPGGPGFGGPGRDGPGGPGQGGPGQGGLGQGPAYPPHPSTEAFTPGFAQQPPPGHQPIPPGLANQPPPGPQQPRAHGPGDHFNPGGDPGRGQPDGEMVLAVTCARDHPNPPEAQRCRRCGGPLQGQPRMMPRPVLALLRPSTGAPVEVDRTVLIGRSPQPNRGSREQPPKLLTVPSPSHDISRTHLQVSPQGWDLLATDLRSTNGTQLIRPGHPEPERIAPGEPIPVYPGCVLDLGDGVSVLVDHPA